MKIPRMVVAAVLAATSSSCGATSPPDLYGERSISIRPGDLRTGVSSDVSDLSVAIEREVPARFRDNELDDWEGNLRLVTWPDTAIVPGAFRTSEDGVFTFRFEPEVALDDGWYALQLDIESLPLRRTPTDPRLVVRDGWTSSRFRVGSYPIVSVHGVFADPDFRDEALPDGTDILFVASELIPFRESVRLAEYLDVTANGSPLRCGDERHDSPPTNTLDQFRVICPRVPEGARITMRFREGLFPEGVQVHTIRGESPPTWDVVEGEPIDGDGSPSDAIFAPADTHVAPEAP